MSFPMVLFPNAKINIGLHIVEKRSDGYHNIESIFYPIVIADALEVGRTHKKDPYIELHGQAIEGDPNDNLVMRAWQLMHREFGIDPVVFHLIKRIPSGGGIGGGSADGAFALKLLNDFFALELNHETLRELALELGSDCPFFIDNQPAWVSGRGEIITPIPNFLQGVYAVLLYGGVHISTAEAYRGITPKRPDISLVGSKLFDRSLLPHLRNDFELPVFQKFPVMAKFKQDLLDSGAFYASLSGTGSCIYGLFESKPTQRMGAADCAIWEGYLP